MRLAVGNDVLIQRKWESLVGSGIKFQCPMSNENVKHLVYIGEMKFTYVRPDPILHQEKWQKYIHFTPASSNFCPRAQNCLVALLF